MNLLKTLASIGSMTFLSRILGFVRDALIARTFGAGMASDAFVVAFKIPNLLRRVFAEGAFSQAFVPILAEHKKQRTPEETRLFLGAVASTLTLCLTVVTAVGMLAAPWIIEWSAPGFAKDSTRMALSGQLLRITFPYILLISLSSFVGSILNSYNQFFVPAFAPTLLNISFIVFSVFLVPYFDPPILALGWAVFVGGLLQLAYQLPYLLKIKMFPNWHFNLKNKEVWRVIRQMGPAILGVSTAQISLLINTAFASFLAAGSVSWMYYADRLMEFPTGVLGVALGTILLPSLSKHAAGKSTEEFSKLLDWGLRLALALAVPSAVGLAVLSKALIATLFMYGKFNAHDLVQTQYALLGYTVGLTALILIKVLAPAFYARQNIRTPVRVSMLTLGVTQLLNVYFFFFTSFAQAGLSLSIGLASCFNASALYYLLLKSKTYQPQTPLRPFVAKLLLAVFGMGLVLFGLEWLLKIQWETLSASWRVLYLSGLIGAGISVYFGLLFALGLRLRDFKRTELN